jgi:thioredoxin-related protein
VFLLLARSPGSLPTAPPDSYDFLPLTDALQRAGAESKPKLLYFGRYGRTACRKMHAEVFTDAELRRRQSTDFVLS